VREKIQQATVYFSVCQREEDEGVDLRIDADEGGMRLVARQAWLHNSLLA